MFEKDFTFIECEKYTNHINKYRLYLDPGFRTAISSFVCLSWTKMIDGWTLVTHNQRCNVEEMNNDILGIMLSLKCWKGWNLILDLIVWKYTNMIIHDTLTILQTITDDK